MGVDPVLWSGEEGEQVMGLVSCGSMSVVAPCLKARARRERVDGEAGGILGSSKVPLVKEVDDDEGKGTEREDEEEDERASESLEVTGDEEDEGGGTEGERRTKVIKAELQ